MRIGLISDTHSFLDPQVHHHFSACDEIWHAGDFGTAAIADELRKIAPLRGVYGNIDGQDIRKQFPHDLRFTAAGVDVFITHIGGRPGRYAIPVRGLLAENPPDIMICGHSHILNVARDPELKNMLFINPGAAGRHGFHTERTLVRFSVEAGRAFDLEVVRLGPRADKED